MGRARRILEKARARRRVAVADSALVGVWDEPVAGSSVLVKGDQLEVSGWLLSSTDGAQPYVGIYVDGDLASEAPAVAPRADVFAALGTDRVGGGWSASVDVADRTWVGIEVIAEDGADRRSLDRRIVRLERETELTEGRGCLDHPVDGDVVVGRVVQLAGWCIFPESETDVVEIYLDNEPAGLARPCDARPDVLGSCGGWDPTALTCGFSDLVVIPPASGGAIARWVKIFVRARANDGRVWQSAVVTVRVEARPCDHTAHPTFDVPRWAARQVSMDAACVLSRPSIGVLTHSLTYGGGELYLQELLIRLADKDFADFFVISPADGPLRAGLEAAGIPVHITREYSVDPEYYGGRSVELAAMLKARGCTAILANTIGAFPAVDAALSAGFRVVWAIHESFELPAWIHMNWGAGGMNSEIEARMVDSLSRSEVVFEADATLRLYQRQIPSLRGRCVRYGIDLTAIAEYRETHDRRSVRAGLGFSDAQRVILCMGVFQERKAQLALVNAFSQLVDANPGARLVLIGDHQSSYSAAIHQLVDHGLAESVRIEPIQPDIYRWYLTADVLVSASDVESLPRSVLESMAFGRPTLATDIFGLGEVVTDGMNGWLCESRSGISLLAGLQRVLAVTDEELAEMSARCLERAVELDGNGYAEAYIGLLADASGRVQDSR